MAPDGESAFTPPAAQPVVLRTCRNSKQETFESSLFEYQDIQEGGLAITERHVIPLLRKSESLGLDLFHDIVTVQANVTLNFLQGRLRVWSTPIVVNDEKPPLWF